MFGFGSKEDAVEHSACYRCGKIGHTIDMEKYGGIWYHPKCLEIRMATHGEVRCPCGNSWVLKCYIVSKARDLGMRYIEEKTKKKGKKK